jgi:predicted aspartyl protease
MKYKFDPEEPVIVLTVTLRSEYGEKKKIEMALDTGATYILIPWDIAEALGYEPAYSNQKIDLTTASGNEKSPLITVIASAFLEKK